MLQGKRKVDVGFKPFHRLYYRCQINEVVGDRLLAASIPYSKTSVNWSKYSFPWDVLFNYNGYGIFSFVVRSLPVELPKKQPPGQPAIPPHYFRPEHVPLPDNYAHSELWAYRQNIRTATVGSLVKKEFRAEMSDRGRLLRYPNI